MIYIQLRNSVQIQTGGQMNPDNAMRFCLPEDELRIPFEAFFRQEEVLLY